MASGAPRSYRGSVYGTGTDLDVKVVGFRPGKVNLFNIDGDVIATWVEGMPDDTAMKTVAAGTTALVDTNGVTPLADGFTIGADGDINVDGEKIVYEATE